MASNNDQAAAATNDNPPTTDNDNKQNDNQPAAAAALPLFIDTTSIVIDNGTYYIKAGHGGDDLPRILTPNVYGNSKDNTDNKLLYGRKALSDNKLTLTYPMENQMIENFDAQEIIWNNLLTNRLKVDPSSQNTLLTETPLNPKDKREKCTQIFFEKFNVPKFYLAIGNVLSLYASGRKNGCVLDCGETLTHTVPVIDGYAVPNAIIKSVQGGKHINANLLKSLNDKGYKIQSRMNTFGIGTIYSLKERVCYVSSNYNNDLKTNKIAEYKLPDGSVIKIGVERFKCVEPLFQPSLFNSKLRSIPKMIYESIQKCDNDKISMLYNNIVLAGGSTLLNGLTKRIENDLTKLVNDNNVKIRIIGPADRKYSAWIGGSILVSLSTFQSMWVTKAEYDEHGASFIHKKCK